MSRFFVPYIGSDPAAVLINGHRFVILSRVEFLFEDNMDLLGADSVKEMASINACDDEDMLNLLAHNIDAGIVLAPDDVELSEVLENLEHEIPWMQ